MAIVLQIQHVSKSFGPRRLFDEATVSIAEGQKIGLIGANGAGKTTLLRMILGQESIDHGTISLHPSTRIGRIEQHENISSEERVIEYLERVSGRETWACAKMAGRFDIKHERLEARFGTLSGGYQMRVRLAGVLVREPNLLLLDEPTNYLDLQTVLLLEDVLRQERGALLVVSHDREFLKNTCTHTLELEHGKLTLYPGDIEAYFEHKEQQLETAKRYNKKIESQRRHLQTFVDRFRYKASLATQAQSKLKQIERLKPIEIAHTLRTVHITIPAPPQKNAEALRCVDLSVGYEPHPPVLRDIAFDIQRGEHVAVVGENGQGKSTLLKTLAGDLAPRMGTYRWAHRLRVAYYAQHVPAMLPREGTAGTYLSAAANTVLPEDLLRMAGNFLFTQDDLEKPLSILSGGERARLCLAGIFLGMHDVLLLDEPTNHLDFDTVEALADALAEFPGTILFVSHDRTFTARIATTIFDIRNSRIRRYPYPYDIYVHELRTHEQLVMPPEEREPVTDGTLPYLRTRSEIYHDIQREKRALKRLEHEMHGLTEEQAELYRFYESSPSSSDHAKAKRLKDIKEEILQQEAAWFERTTAIDLLERELKLQE